MTPRARTTLVVGLAAVAVLVIATAVAWPTLRVWYYVGMLESEPDRLVEFLAAEEGSWRQQALERFARTPAGKDRLVLAYCETVFRVSEHTALQWGEFEQTGTFRWIFFWAADELLSVRWATATASEWANGEVQGRGGDQRVPDVELLYAFQDLLVAVGYWDYPFPTNTEVRVCVATIDELGSSAAWDGFRDEWRGPIFAARKVVKQPVSSVTR